MRGPRRLNTVLPQQLRFDFEQESIAGAAGVMKAQIAAAIAEEGALSLADLAAAFRGRAAPWTATRILEVLRELIYQDHIVFDDSDGPIEKNRALRLLLQPSAWETLRVAHAPQVAHNELAAARKLAQEITPGEIPRDQNALCHWWRNRIRSWKSDLERYRPLADSGAFPGKKNIHEICEQSDRLLAEHDPCRFIQAVNGRRRRIPAWHAATVVLKRFYTREIDAWKMLTNALQTFEPNRRELLKDPRSRGSLAELERIARDPEPYGRTGGIVENVVTVKRVNDEIVERKTAEARERGMQELRRMISGLREALESAGAGRDLRNRCLHPLQTIGKALQRAANPAVVDALMRRAADQLDLSLDMIQT